MFAATLLIIRRSGFKQAKRAMPVVPVKDAVLSVKREEVKTKK